MVKTEHGLFLTNADIADAAYEISQKIIRECMTPPDSNIISGPGCNIYGIPRGGIPVAYAVKGALHTRGLFVVNVVDDPAMADVFVDDVIASGRTRDHMATHYPGVPFYALFEGSSEWLIFPWEQAIAQGDSETSAEDIPIRLLQYVGENTEREGLRDTPRRFLKAWQFYTSGYSAKDEDVAKVLQSFKDGAERCGDEFVIVQDIPVYSQCEHHLAPFFGTVTIGYIPDGRVVGLSKFKRLVEIFARRLQVQERLTNQIADALEQYLHPKGVGVVMKCRHMCMESRGIQTMGSQTVTSALRGVVKNEAKARAEFMGLVK